jgi:hypothetical protein
VASGGLFVVVVSDDRHASVSLRDRVMDAAWNSSLGLRSM